MPHVKKAVDVRELEARVDEVEILLAATAEVVHATGDAREATPLLIEDVRKRVGVIATMVRQLAIA